MGRSSCHFFVGVFLRSVRHQVFSIPVMFWVVVEHDDGGATLLQNLQNFLGGWGGTVAKETLKKKKISNKIEPNNK